MSGLPTPAQPSRVIADLRDLAGRTGDANGAHRLCWTPTWQVARGWLRDRLAELPCTVEIDEAGNLWATLKGASDRVVVVGSHIDSVPNGGWLDGVLGVTTALEMLRLYAHTTPPVTLRLVDWADEEGARFGRSLFGSSAAAGTLQPDLLRDLRDRDGVTLPDALAANGVDLDSAHQSARQLRDVAAYLEIHIEQGPILEQRGLPIGPVLGTYGVERHAIHVTGRTSHSGSTPIALRRDAFLTVARLALEARESALRRAGVATVGSITVTPGIVTAVPGTCVATLDQRALDADQLAGMFADVQAAAERIAAAETTAVEWEHLWRIEPRPFHPRLISFAADACRQVAGTDFALPSGALHDAAEMARLVPTVMMFTSSIGGVSHNPIEDTPIAHLELAVHAFARLTASTVDWVAAGSPA